MNVGELVAELSKLDPNLPVVTFDREDGWEVLERVEHRPSEYGYYADMERVPAGTQVVELR